MLTKSKRILSAVLAVFMLVTVFFAYERIGSGCDDGPVQMRSQLGLYADG